MLKRYLIMFGVLVVMLAGSPQVGMSATIEELERRLDLVTEELQKMKNESAVTEVEYKSTYGFGPAASKVYSVSKGLSIGGYGEAHYSNYVNDEGTKKDQADFLRFVLYAGYKFTDNIILNSEIEFEHASTGEDGEVSLELANLDFLLDEKFNIRAGLMLLPVGITNELHEPTLFHGNDRPYVERYVIPSTWREMGVGAFGKIAEGLDYKLYTVNGLDASGFDSKGIRGGRQKGSKALAEDWAVVANLNYEPVLGLNLGTSAYLGDSGHDQEFAGKKVDVFTQIYEVHGQYKVAGLELKALASLVDIDDTDYVSAEVGEDVPERVSGWYGEVAYDVFPLIAPDTDQYLAPFVRYEQIDYRGSNEDVDLFVAGISYKPTTNVVIKADYRNFDNKHKENTADEVNLGLGFIF
jgi:opacity protein-like surface antigen